MRSRGGNVSIDLHRLGPTIESALDSAPWWGSPTQLGRHYIEEVGATEAQTWRQNRAHSPTSATLPIEGVPEATGNLPLGHHCASPAVATALHCTNSLHLHRRASSSTSTANGQCLSALALSTLSRSTSRRTMFYPLKRKVPRLNLLLEDPEV